VREYFTDFSFASAFVGPRFEKGGRVEHTDKGANMSATLKKNDPARAREYFADKMAFTTGPVELHRNLGDGNNIVVIDVREAEDYEKGHIPGAINLPHDKWNTVEGLKKDTLNVLYCYSHVCHLAATAAVEFAGKGYPVMEMDGGFDAWQENDLEIERGATPSRASSGRSMTASI
jgi:rhodanese-related sulfurtransferase